MSYDTRSSDVFVGPVPPLSERQCEIASWLKDVAPFLVEAYTAAAYLVEDTSFPCREHLVAHLVRDLINRLADVVAPDDFFGRVEYSGFLDDIEKDWKTIEGKGDDGAPGQADSVRLDYRLARKVDRLVRDHRSSRSRGSPSERLVRGLQGKSIRNDANQRVVSTLEGVRAYFMSCAHLPGSLKEFDEIELVRKFREFERILSAHVGRFTSERKKLDELIQKANS